MNKLVVSTPLGKLALIQEGGKITRLFLQAAQAPTDIIEKETPLLKQARQQLNEYFSAQRRLFDIPLEAAGSTFEKQVWHLLQTIPYGKTCSYADIARLLGKPGAARAVGGACHRNPLPIFIPCHRVIGSRGKLTGYAGGLQNKQQLLDLERKARSNKMIG